LKEAFLAPLNLGAFTDRLGPAHINHPGIHINSNDAPLVSQTYSPQSYWILLPDLTAIRIAVRDIFAGASLVDAVRRPGSCCCSGRVVKKGCVRLFIRFPKLQGSTQTAAIQGFYYICNLEQKLLQWRTVRSLMTILSVSELTLPARLWLARGKQALQTGKRDEAVAAFRRAVVADPKHIDSWLWLAGFCEDPHESLRCLARVLELDVQNEVAHEGIRWARKLLAARDEPTAPAAPVAESAQRARAPHVVTSHILRSAVVLVLLFIALGSSSGSFGEKSVPTVAAAPSEAELDISLSVPTAELVNAVAPSFNPFSEAVQRDLQYQLDFDKGVALRLQEDLPGAMKAFQAAVNLDANAVEARSELVQLKGELAARAGSPASDSAAVLAASGAKWIDVNLTTQHFRAMRGQTTVYSFPASTGRPSMATVPGRFKILDKIPNAYSNIWKLKSPYWMGIYWAGKAENGIHALPIDLKGRTLWGNLLGHRASYGCVVLDTKAARTVFNWAEVGTPVIIHY
jgi:lipoprotein-anchoring transpeptidase ErfK/SrfK